jgi:hypothetical protein
MLQMHIPEFRKSDLLRRLAIVQTGVEWIRDRWHGNAKFDELEVEKVCSI